MTPRIVLALLAALTTSAPSAIRAQALPGTTPWEDRGDPAAAMVAGIGRFLDRELAASVERRQENWHRDFSSAEAYARSVEPNRQRFLKIIGAVDPRVTPVEVAYVATTDSPAKVAETPAFTAYAVRWGVYDDVEAEGLLLEPKGEARANVVAMGDCRRHARDAGRARARAGAARAGRAAPGRGRLPRAGADADRPLRRVLGQPAGPDDQPAAPRVGLPHGLRDGPARHRLRGGQGPRGGRLVHPAGAAAGGPSAWSGTAKGA